MPVVLDPGDSSNEDIWLPQITLEHEGEGGHELYVVVGEEVGGMIEGVPYESFERITKRLADAGSAT